MKWDLFFREKHLPPQKKLSLKEKKCVKNLKAFFEEYFWL